MVISGFDPFHLVMQTISLIGAVALMLFAGWLMDRLLGRRCRTPSKEQART